MTYKRHRSLDAWPANIIYWLLSLRSCDKYIYIFIYIYTYMWIYIYIIETRCKQRWTANRRVASTALAVLPPPAGRNRQDTPESSVRMLTMTLGHRICIDSKRFQNYVNVIHYIIYIFIQSTAIRYWRIMTSEWYTGHGILESSPNTPPLEQKKKFFPHQL